MDNAQLSLEASKQDKKKYVYAKPAMSNNQLILAIKQVS
jgi:hypothetical protein